MAVMWVQIILFRHSLLGAVMSTCFYKTTLMILQVLRYVQRRSWHACVLSLTSWVEMLMFLIKKEVFPMLVFRARPGFTGLINPCFTQANIFCWCQYFLLVPPIVYTILTSLLSQSFVWYRLGGMQLHASKPPRWPQLQRFWKNEDSARDAKWQAFLKTGKRAPAKTSYILLPAKTVIVEQAFHDENTRHAVGIVKKWQAGTCKDVSRTGADSH